MEMILWVVFIVIVLFLLGCVLRPLYLIIIMAINKWNDGEVGESMKYLGIALFIVISIVLLIMGGD